jgi:hypothetical protein
VSVFGTVYQVASEDCTFTDRIGTSYIFRAGLTSTAINRALAAMGNSAPNEPNVTITDLHIDGALQRYAQGGIIISGRGELAVIVRGEPWESRVILCSGRVRDARVKRGDFVDLFIGDRLGDDKGTLIPASAVVNSDTFPSHADNVADSFYPVVFGEPGVYVLATGASATTTGSPALMVDTTGGSEVILISLGHVEAQNVTITNGDDATSESFAVTQTEDGLGQVVSVVSLSGAATLTVDQAATYYARWTGGGGIKADSGQLLEGAGSVLIWALRRTTLRIDYASLESARSILDNYIVGGFVNDTGFSSMEWIADNLLPILPISLTFGPDGLGVTVHKTDYRRSDIELTLDEDSGAGVRIIDDGLGNFGSAVGGFRLAYAWSVALERARRIHLITGDPEVLALNAPNIRPDLLCARAYDISASSNGTKTPTVEELETRIVYDEATAHRILTTLSRLRAIPPQEVQLDVPWSVAARLRLGQVVQVASTDYHLDRPGRVAELGYSRDGVRVRVLFDADFERDRYNRT